MFTRRVATGLPALLFLSCHFSRMLQAQGTQAKGGQASNREADIRALIDAYVTARKLADPAQLGALFTPDADQLVSTGEWRRGRVDLVQGTVQSSRREKGERSILVERIRFLRDDVALVDARYEVTSAQSAPRHMRTTILCQSDSGSWKIAAIRNMLPVP